MPFVPDQQGARPVGRFVPDEPAEPTRTGAQQFAHEQGVGARNTIEGLASVVTVPSDALAGLVDLALEKSGVKFRLGSSREGLHNLLSKIGLPEEEGDGEELAGKFGRAIASVPGFIATGGAMAAGGGAGPVAAGVGRTMASNPVLQAAGAATGTASSEVAREAGAGPVVQTLAGLAGAAAPSVAAAGASAAVRGGLRGGEQGRLAVLDNLDTFNRAGTTPTVGQATEGRVARAAESLLSRTPGGAGAVARRAEGQAEDVGARLEEQAKALVGRNTSAEQTGRKIETSVRGEKGFVARFKTQQEDLYDKLDEFVPQGTRVAVARTKDALGRLNAAIPGAPNVSKFFQNTRIKGIEGALKADTEGFSSVEANPENAALFSGGKISKDDAALLGDVLADGKLPYEALKKLRTMVGNELADAGIASDVPRSKWKALYAALSDDLGEAVAGNPQAKSAWQRANTFTRAGMKRIEAIESVIDRSGGPEAIFKAATAGTREGASTLRSVMQSVDDEGQRMITATVLRRLGKAKAGVQGDLGDQFSTETFLTNWNGLSTEAKRTLFNRYGDKFRGDMDQVAKFAANLREGSQVFRNPSGTSQAMGLQATAGTVGAIAMAALTGHVAEAAAGATALTGVVGGANASARLMTNPQFVRWLAQSTRMPASAYSAQVERLASQATSSKDMDLARAAVLLREQNPGDEAEQGEQQPRQGQ